MSERDKRIIWDYCPSCAHKHLTAAYAALTSEVSTDPEFEVHVPADRVFAARARILQREADAGYAGNLDAAIGCLAMAEGECYDRQQATAYREERLTLAGELRSTTFFMTPFTLSELAAGHIVEAFREIGEPLSENRALSTALINGSFHVVNVVEYLDALRAAIFMVADTYCLRGERNAKS